MFSFTPSIVHITPALQACFTKFTEIVKMPQKLGQDSNERKVGCELKIEISHEFVIDR